jgi:hypothetical protein
MLIRLTPPPAAPTTLGCAECALAFAGLGCVPQCNGCPKRGAGLGAFDFGSAGIGAGTIAVIAVVAIAAYALMGSPAKERRNQLAAAKTRYREEVRKIRAKFGRFGKRGD